MLAYPVEFTPDENGTLLVTCPDLPEVTTFGEDHDDALARALDAIEEALAARIADREDIPEPSVGKHMAGLPTQTAIKVIIYRTMRAEGLNKSQLARKLHWHRPQVDRLLDLNHATRLDHLDAVFDALGVKMEVSVTSRKRTGTAG